MDYHQHLVSPSFASIAAVPQRDAKALLGEMDRAAVRRAVVLSVGYSFADERKGLSDPDRRTREENDWTSAQVSGGGRRLIGFCSANPLRDTALTELERCLTLTGMVGIKQHFGNAGVTLRNPGHLERMRRLFTLAERRRAPVLVHLRSRGGTNFGAPDARLLLDHLAGAAPSIEIVIAHLGSSGPGYTPQHEEVLMVLSEAVSRGKRRSGKLYIDLSGVVTAETTADQGAKIAARIREVGPDRILFGSDLLPAGGSIRSGWDMFRLKVPLTVRELRIIATNRTRFAR